MCPSAIRFLHNSEGNKGSTWTLGVGNSKSRRNRWVALKALVDSILAATHGRVQARRLASVTGTVLSMHLSWGPVTQLYSRYLYALIDSVWSLNCWLVVTEEARNELLFWQDLPRLRSEGAIWPPSSGVTIRMTSYASDIGWGGGTSCKVPRSMPTSTSRRRRASSPPRIGSCSASFDACNL